jgi:hypothetical protein
MTFITSCTNNYLHIVMKMVLFYTENRSESTQYFFASFYSMSLEMIVKAYLFL